MKKAVIYTRKGDDGTTSLVGGERVRKDSLRVETYGTIDELNAHLGLLASAMEQKEHSATIDEISNRLFAIGGYLANTHPEHTPITNQHIKNLEEQIDKLDNILEPINQFLLPPCNKAAALANICRTVCRRAERRILTLSGEANIAPLITAYVNRLSDYLFTLSRILSQGNEKFVEKY